jgi:3-keto-disaccharide hydrolase
MTESSWPKNALAIIGVTAAIALGVSALPLRAQGQPAATAAASQAPSAQESEGETWKFDTHRAFAADQNWTAVEGDWEVLHDPTAPSAPNTFGLTKYGLPRTEGNLRWLTSFIRTTYPIAVANDPREYSNFTAEADFKTTGGAWDRSGGLIFRYVDAKNYYVLAAECPANRLVLYRMKDGKLAALKSISTVIEQGEWYGLKVETQGDRFVGFLNGKKMLEAKDDSFEKGRIGLWGRDDSLARFDNVTVKPLPSAG